MMQIEYCHAKKRTMQFCRQVSECFHIYCRSIKYFLRLGPGRVGDYLSDCEE